MFNRDNRVKMRCFFAFQNSINSEVYTAYVYSLFGSDFNLAISHPIHLPNLNNANILQTTKIKCEKSFVVLADFQ